MCAETRFGSAESQHGAHVCLGALQVSFYLACILKGDVAVSRGYILAAYRFHASFIPA